MAPAPIQAVIWHDAHDGRPPIVRVLDQRRLPASEVWLDCGDEATLQEAIRTLAVRGAPAIGVAAAYGVAQAMLAAGLRDRAARLEHLRGVCERFAATRPTAVNLFWALDRMRQAGAVLADRSEADFQAGLVAAAKAIHADDIACCRAIGEHGAPLLPRHGGVITHCNAGALATGGHGTALGVIRTAVAAGHDLHVWVDETRPLLQGARLTAWECAHDGIPATLIADNMAGWVLKQGQATCAVVGADRIARNGDSANKIGSYALAVLCKHHGVPFYVAAPTSTVDLACGDGDAIPIEQRAPQEITHLHGQPVAATGVGVFNPAFDVVPHALIAAIVTEVGVARPPFADALTAMVARAERRRQEGP
jgi:methylthioribose-1-phosphate isomerase